MGDFGQPLPARPYTPTPTGLNSNPYMDWLRAIVGQAPNEANPGPEATPPGGIWRAGWPGGPQVTPSAAAAALPPTHPGMGTQVAPNPPASPVGSPGAIGQPMPEPGQQIGGPYSPQGYTGASPGNASAAPSPSLGASKKGTVTGAPLPPPRPKSPNLGRYPAPPGNPNFTTVQPWTGSGQQVTALDLSRLFRRQP